MRELRSWRARQNAERLLTGAGWPATDLVFTHADGTGLWPPDGYGSAQGDRGPGLKQIGVHGLRHSAATYLIKAGRNPRIVQERLGHSHVAVTLALYTDVVPADDRGPAMRSAPPSRMRL
jgi:integrase